MRTYTEVVVSYLHMNELAYVAYIWHFRGIFVDGTYMTIAW